MVIKELLQNSITKLRESGNDNPVFEAHAIFRHVLSLSATDLVLMHDKKISKSHEKKLSDFLKRRIQGEPLQYILGTQEFMSLEFKVTPSVLIPRADTETLVEYVIDKKKNDDLTGDSLGNGVSGKRIDQVLNYLNTNLDTADGAYIKLALGNQAGGGSVADNQELRLGTRGSNLALDQNFEFTTALVIHGNSVKNASTDGKVLAINQGATLKLNKASWIPVNIIVYNSLCILKVLTLRETVGCNKDSHRLI